ncbi:MAG: nickel pincer cofactor biosynthesis protein LarC, partial [Candidatus Omnitrophica bacterium]|nr:nickel pincer cofactor biosynthesis protein LarC [Candidatus Omnitrophota bacterium]
MKILRLDCQSGISGDMFIGALIGCGLGIGRLESGLRRMKIGKYRISARKVKRSGIAGVKFDVAYKKHHGHGHTKEKTFAGISRAIRASGLSARVKDMSMAVFTNLAKAEAKAHGIIPARVHFHEVGDIDSVVDIVGACIGMEALGVERVFASNIVSGSGTILVHGVVFPNPAPATAYLLEGFDIKIEDTPFELITPTGAAILKTFSTGRGTANIPECRILKSGYGAGSLEIPGHANLLRAILCEAPEEGAAPGPLAAPVTVLETNIDDMNPQVYGYLTTKLLDAGALDVYMTPVIMKKSRPGCVLTVIAGKNDAQRLSEMIFEETPTFGIRRHDAERDVLGRKIVEVNTKYGNIRVKLG